MNLRHLTSLATMLVAGVCVAAEPTPDTARPYVHSALVASAQRRQRAAPNQIRPAAFNDPQPAAAGQRKPGARMEMMAYDQPTYTRDRFAQKEPVETPAEGNDKPSDPFSDPEPTDQPAEQPAEMPAEAPPELAPDAAPPGAEPAAQEPAARPGDDLFTVPPSDKQPDEAMPGREGANNNLPFVDPGAPPRRTPAPREQVPTREMAPRGEFVPTPEPDQGPTNEPYYGEYGLTYDDDGFADSCMSCAESAGCGSMWDNYCPPPLNLRIPCGSWVNMEYLMWWSRGASLPPLATTGSQGGALDDPNVKILFGDDRVDNGIRSGGRLNIGTWFNARQTFGIGASFIGLQNMASNFTAVSDGTTTLARPYFDTQTNSPNAFVIAQSGLLSGGIRVRTTDSFVAGDTYLRQVLAAGPRRRVDLIYGWRYLELDDSVGIDDHSVSIDPNNPQVPLGTTLVGFDGFRATNKFNGGQIGIMTERRRGIWSLNTVAKVSLGNMRQTVLINGYSSTTVPGQTPANFVGDLFAQQSNIGRYDRNVFAAIPEVTLNLGCQITPRMRATFGYSLIWISNVVQAGRQIDTNVDLSQSSSFSAPTFTWQQNTYWLQGMNFGLNFTF
ncbi:MAG TPA: BBP7 family outer membrane beta-barrel protein [Pirellulales bacterium]